MFKFSTIKYFLAVCLFFPGFSFAEDGAQRVAAYFQSWLGEHQIESTVGDNHMLLIDGTGLKVGGGILKEGQRGEGTFVTQTQLRVMLANGKMIVENTVGVGPDADSAFMASLQSLRLTTFRPIYAALLKPDSEYVNRREVVFSDVNRSVFFTDWVTHGDEVSQAELDGLMDEVFAAMQPLALDNDVHWVKVVVLSMNGLVDFIEVTLDNELDDGIGSKLMTLQWPASENFYVLKLFFVISRSE